ncbi:hypothetical protein GOL88_27870 [Sinorhizobium medicae]|nr:hypothetical protein [Sinorhizobium medicae]
MRIEAGRIRRALERYYLVAGRNDPVVISIPKGGYVPIFEKQADGSKTSLIHSKFPAAMDLARRRRDRSCLRRLGGKRACSPCFGRELGNVQPQSTKHPKTGCDAVRGSLRNARHSE